VRVIIAGSREGFKLEDVYTAMKDSQFAHKVTEIVSGTARGVDRLGEQYAKDHNIPVKKFPADWDKHGKSGGYIRNAEMAKYADAAVILWDGESKGTKHMIDIAEKEGIPYSVLLDRKPETGCK